MESSQGKVDNFWRKGSDSLEDTIGPLPCTFTTFSVPFSTATAVATRVGRDEDEEEVELASLSSGHIT